MALPIRLGYESGRVILMDVSEEALIKDDLNPAEDDVLREAWPIPPEDYIREFEEYLDEIGLRF